MSKSDVKSEGSTGSSQTTMLPETSTSIASVRPFDFKQSNLDEEWKKWKERFSIYLHATGLNASTNVRKVCLLLHMMGEGVSDIYASFEMKTDEVQYDDLVKKFDEYFLPKKNLAMERYNLFTHKQAEGVSLSEYVTSLKTLAGSCELNDLKESIVRDLFICGIRDNAITKKLLRENHDRLDKVVEVANTYVLTNRQAEQASGQSAADVNVVSERQSRPRQKSQSRGNSKSRNPQQMNGSNRPCGRCGTTHQFKQCPAWGSECHSCKGTNHWSKMCRKKIDSKKVNLVEANENFFIGSIETTEFSREKWWVSLKILNQRKRFQIDTGSMVNLMSRNTLNELGIPIAKLRKVHTSLNTINSTVNVLGQVQVLVTYKDRDYKLEFIVVETCTDPIVGLQACQTLNLVKLVKK